MSDKLKDNQHFHIAQKDVEHAFLAVKEKESHSPDNICGQLLKSCAKQLSTVFQNIFNRFLQEQHVPQVWKDAVVVPVPKVRGPKTLNDFRLVALTSILIKTLEKLVK